MLCLAFVVVLLGGGAILAGTKQAEQVTQKLQADLATAEAENVALENSLAEVEATIVTPTFITITQLVTQTQIITQTDVALAHQIGVQALTQLNDNLDLAIQF